MGLPVRLSGSCAIVSQVFQRPGFAIPAALPVDTVGCGARCTGSGSAHPGRLSRASVSFDVWLKLHHQRLTTGDWTADSGLPTGTADWDRRLTTDD
jgi:hypothetical protein